MLDRRSAVGQPPRSSVGRPVRLRPWNSGITDYKCCVMGNNNNSSVKCFGIFDVMVHTRALKQRLANGGAIGDRTVFREKIIHTQENK